MATAKESPLVRQRSASCNASCAAAPSTSTPTPDTTERQEKVRYYDSKKELLQNLSQLRDSIHCDRQLAERDNFLKKASHQMSHCKSVLREKWTGLGSRLTHSFKKSIGWESDDEGVFDCEKFSKITDFAECCKVISGRLETVNKVFERELVPSGDLQETLRQLLEKEILLSFYGQFSAGKSTLVNALLKDRFLPTNRNPETSFRLTIQSSEGRGQVRAGLKAHNELEGERDIDSEISENHLIIDGTVVANGSSEILKTLEHVNIDVREKEDEGRRSYVLRVKMTLFAHVLEGWQVSLTDNPGCDQGHDHVYDTALQSLKISSACFYVATYEQYRTRDTARFFRKMYEENKDVFKQKRLIAIVNKVDLVCGDCFEEEERLDPDGVVNIVHNCICKICGCSSEEVPKEVVIPISGKWAYLARAFLKNPSDAKRKKAVIRVLADHSNQPAGQGESLESVFARKTDTQLTSELEGLSNIRGLEKRLQDVARSCVDVWMKKMENDYLHYLKSCISKLLEQAQSLEEDLNERERSISSRLEAMTQIHTIFREIVEKAHASSPSKSPIWREFQASYLKDIKMSNAKSDAEEQIRRQVREFQERTSSKIRAGNYGPEDFMGDLGTVAQEASTTYNDRMNRCFNELLLTRSSHLSRVTSDVARMATLMEKLNPSSQEYDSMLANGFRESTPNIASLSFKETCAIIEAPNVNANLLEKIRIFCQHAIESIKMIFTPDPSYFDVSPASPDSNRGRSTSGSEQNNPRDQLVHEDATVADQGGESVTPGPDESPSEGDTTPATTPDENSSDDQLQNLSTLEVSVKLDEQVESPSPHGKKRSSQTYSMRWISKINNVIRQLQDCIEREIQSHFGNFEERVVKAYWESYCKLAMKKLENFESVFSDQLNEQIEHLTADIDLLLQMIDKRQWLKYHIEVLKYILAQFQTLAGKCSMELNKQPQSP